MTTMEKTTDTDGLQLGRSPMTVAAISDGLMMKEPPQPAKKVAGNPLRRTEMNLTRFSAVLPASDVDGGSDVALGYGDVEADLEPNSTADLADDNDLAQRLDGHSADISIARADVSNGSEDSRADVSIDAAVDVISDAAADVISDAAADVIKEVGKKQLFDTTMIVNVECNMANEKSFVAPVQTGLYVGNIPLNAYPEPIIDDKIAHAFNHSTRKTLKFIAPTLQNGEVIVRPTLYTIRNGSKRWKTTAVGYFLGKRPYFHHLKEYAVSVWPCLREGQPIVLQKWEPGMVLRKLKHTQVPVWIKLRHLPVELWTEEGLSIVASGVGKPLYPDAITRACTRLDFTRVCVMLDVNSKMPKHIIIMTPDEEGGELPCKINVEYEWLPPRCTSCMTLGHSAKECIVNKPKSIKPPVNVYVPKVGALRDPMELRPARGRLTVMKDGERRTVLFAGNNSGSDNGNDDTVISEDGKGSLTSNAAVRVFGRRRADEGTPDSVEEVETTLNEKGENLAYDSSSFRAPPRLGFGEASPFINGGRKFEPFNLDEFLKLANVVINKGDEQTITALRDLKTRWKERFRSVPSLHSLV
ncbi:UNVERIFIED_CONTAM: hypothetical protein Sindi_0076400 [Sesamum indicum]